MKHLPLPLATALLCLSTQAQTLLAPPVSPAPVTHYEYDAQGNPTKTVQAPGTLNLSTQATYDRLSRLKDSTDAKLGKTQFSYDGLDRTLKITDPRNLVTQTPRNGLGDATQLISPTPAPPATPMTRPATSKPAPTAAASKPATAMTHSIGSRGPPTAKARPVRPIAGPTTRSVQALPTASAGSPPASARQSSARGQPGPSEQDRHHHL